MTDERYFSPDDVAHKLNVKPLTVRRWLKGGKLKGLKVGRLWRVRESELEAFLKGGEDHGKGD
jgi:excisionase family DNA binding protein